MFTNSLSACKYFGEYGLFLLSILFSLLFFWAIFLLWYSSENIFKDSDSSSIIKSYWHSNSSCSLLIFLLLPLLTPFLLQHCFLLIKFLNFQLAHQTSIFLHIVHLFLLLVVINGGNFPFYFVSLLNLIT